MDNKKTIITSLISLRFFFALRVYGVHLGSLIQDKSAVYNWLHQHVLSVPFGVSFFYILSGFVLAYTYQNRILDGTKSIREFYIQRIARIYPLHIVTLLLVIPLTNEFFNVENLLGWLVKFFSQVTLTQSFVPIKSVYFSYNGASWSLSNAMFFYLAFPFLILFHQKIKQSKLALWIGAIVVIGLPLTMLTINSDLNHWLFYINPFFRTIDFFIGIILYNLYFTIKRSTKASVLNCTLLEISSIVLFVVFLYFHKNVTEVIKYSYYTWLPLGFIIFAFSFQDGFISKKLLNHRLLIQLGEVSFGIYIFHSIILRYFNLFNTQWFNIQNVSLIVFITLSLTIAASYISAKFIEKPLSNEMIKLVKVCSSRIKVKLTVFR